ncbi:kinase-like domain-containing protein [Mycena maculata]|uniref:Kinase-like domain-containing protein n=1 Tax=Mycena maculata TaxID=230809 RepID=A0AAD7K6N2_9AGAR|nr:kinase-like domain-containing protein [Mycena maculata]
MSQADAWRTHHLILKLSQSSNILPSPLFIGNISECDRFFRRSGGYGEIYRASYQERAVALKRLSTPITADLDVQRRARIRFCQEALTWRRLQHKFIVPLLGIDRDTFPPYLVMVSPWMEHGTVLDYIKTNGTDCVERLLFEVAQGLAHLHSMNIVHGDLRGANILINDDLHACLTDFGLSGFSDTTETGTASTSNRAGSLRWMAPELIDPPRFGRKHFLRTTASDAYAFACVCIELYTGSPPFLGLCEGSVLLQVIAGHRPSRPDDLDSDALWNRMAALWAEDPEARPSITSIAEFMRDLCGAPKEHIEESTIDSLHIMDPFRNLDVISEAGFSTSSYASTNSDFWRRNFPRRFFVLKCPNEVRFVRLKLNTKLISV